MERLWCPISGPAPAPGGRRARKKQRTRRDIYHAALHLFAQDGFEAVTIDAICAQADVARATFFGHFPTKAALLLEFNRVTAAEFRNAQDEPRGAAIDELRALIEFLAARWLEHAESMGAMLREFMLSPEALAAVDTALDLEDVICEIVTRGQARGEFRAGLHPRLATALIMATAASILSGRVYRPGEATPHSAREQFLDVVLAALCGEPSEKHQREGGTDGPRDGAAGGAST